MYKIGPYLVHPSSMPLSCTSSYYSPILYIRSYSPILYIEFMPLSCTSSLCPYLVHPLSCTSVLMPLSCTSSSCPYLVHRVLMPLSCTSSYYSPILYMAFLCHYLVGYMLVCRTFAAIVHMYVECTTSILIPMYMNVRQVVSLILRVRERNE